MSVHGVGLGSGVGLGPRGLQPTDDGVQMPGAPGAALASLAQQRRVVSPHGFCVPVVQAQPTPGRDGSVQMGNAVAVGAAAVAVGAAAVAVGAGAVAVGCAAGVDVAAAVVGVGPLGGAGQNAAWLAMWTIAVSLMVWIRAGKSEARFWLTQLAS